MLGEKHCSWRLALLDYEKGIGLNLDSKKGSRSLGTVAKGFMISTWSSFFCGKSLFSDFLACWQIGYVGRSVRWNML